MTRGAILQEMKEMLGLVPGMFEALPDAELEYEWGIFKALELGSTDIPNKYKELIGVGVSAALRCRYCSLFHTEAARLNGATEAEIQEALRMAKLVAGWSTYLNGSRYDLDRFEREVKAIVAYVRSGGKKPVPVG